MKKTLKRKFSEIYSILILGIFIMGIISIFSVHTIKEEANRMLSENYNNIQAADQMLELLDRQDSAILTYMSIDEEKGIAVFTEGMQSFLSWLYKSIEEVETDDEKELLMAIQNQYDYYSKAFSFLQEDRAKKGYESAITYYNQELLTTFEELKGNLRAFRDGNIENMLVKKEQIIEKTNKLTGIIIGFTLGIGLLGYYFSLRRVRDILKPLGQLAGRIKKVTAGKENEQLEVKSSDEIGILETELNQMIARLKIYDESNVGKLIAEKKKFETIFNNIEEPFFIINNQLMIETLNPAAEKCFSVKEEESIHKHLLEVLPSKELLNIIYKMREEEKEREEKIIQLASQEMIFNVVISKCFFSDCETYKWIILMQDITRIKKTEKIRTDFIATVSHELKTPLTSIEMGMSMLLNQEIGELSLDQNEILDVIQDDVDRLSKLIEELLELSKIESGNVIYSRVPTDIYKVAQASIKQFVKRARYSEVQLESQIEEGLPAVHADGEKLVWVFNNILNNAFKYTKAGDKITVSSVLRTDFIEICIHDSGMGIQEGYLEKLFERDFHHSDQDIEYRGSGIGLYLSKQIILAHEGQIWAESKPMYGSRFIFTIPLARSKEA